jgi:putative tricarboxylic transport membrane protein
MDILSGLASGFQTVLQPSHLFYCFVGVFIGTLIGVLPGIGPVGAMSILLPITFGISSVSSIIMLAGIYYGAQYGGSTTSILVNIPGESSSVITCLDGYQMARNGRAGPALGISAFGSLIGGTLGVIGLMFLAIPLAQMGLKIGPPEFFSIICMSMTILIYLARGSVVKAIVMIMIIFGIVGYILRKFDYEMAPMICAFVLGPMLERNFRLSLVMSDGSFSIFMARPVSLVCLVISVLLFISVGFSYFRKIRKMTEATN